MPRTKKDNAAGGTAVDPIAKRSPVNKRRPHRPPLAAADPKPEAALSDAPVAAAPAMAAGEERLVAARPAKASRRRTAMASRLAEPVAAPVAAAPTSTAPAASPVSSQASTTVPSEADAKRIFALDIGTRSVIGIVAEPDEKGVLQIIATTRQEHKTRAMLDGQIHDVLQVSAVIESVKRVLARKTGPLHYASVAAAGRALYTVTAEAANEINGTITAEQQKDLDFAAVQAAQAKLATTHTVDDPTRYYCVGFSNLKYLLDDEPLKTLVGQRGQTAKAVVIATFLPRQVIDSMQSALQQANLDIRALTLEPIAAINVLIPPTMHHLNLVLVDIGAGTSDVAITKDGSVIAYGMVPQAGDEITEAISQKFLLDFNVAEAIKRKAAGGNNATFSDILGMNYTLSAEEVIEPIKPSIKNLAEAIASQIKELNGGDVPQAVMLVGGGSLTPHLPQLVAEALAMPENRVAVRHPEAVEGVGELPASLRSPDAVTPLGILKIASSNTLHFLSVKVNGVEHSLFNFRELTISDALLAAGIKLRKYNGRPGLGLMVTVAGEKKFFPGTMGTLAKLELDGRPASLATPIKDGCQIDIKRGEDGTTPVVRLSEAIPSVAGDYALVINGQEEHIQPTVTVNGQPAKLDALLRDGDTVELSAPRTLGEALLAAGYPPTGRQLNYTLNGKAGEYTITPEITSGDEPADLSQPLAGGEQIEYAVTEPKLGDLIKGALPNDDITIFYNNAKYQVPTASVSLEMNGRPASLGTLAEDDCLITYRRTGQGTATVSDALLAVNFQPPPATSRVTFTILVNNEPADFVAPIKNGDTLAVILKPIERPTAGGGLAKEGSAAKATASRKTANATSATSAASAKNTADATQTEATAKADGQGRPNILSSIFAHQPTAEDASAPGEASPAPATKAKAPAGKKRRLTIEDFIRHD